MKWVKEKGRQSYGVSTLTETEADAFTETDTKTDTDKQNGFGTQWNRSQSLFRCNVNTSALYNTTHFYRYQCLYRSRPVQTHYYFKSNFKFLPEMGFIV